MPHETTENLYRGENMRYVQRPLPQPATAGAAAPVRLACIGAGPRPCDALGGRKHEWELDTAMHPYAVHRRVAVLIELKIPDVPEASFHTFDQETLLRSSHVAPGPAFSGANAIMAFDSYVMWPSGECQPNLTNTQEEQYPSLFLPVPDTVCPKLFGRLAIFDASADGSGELLTFFHDVTRFKRGGMSQQGSRMETSSHDGQHYWNFCLRDHSLHPQARPMIPVEETEAFRSYAAAMDPGRFQSYRERLIVRLTRQFNDYDPLNSNTACGIGLRGVQEYFPGVATGTHLLPEAERRANAEHAAARAASDSAFAAYYADM